MRLSVGLTVAGGILLISGIIMTLVGAAMRLNSQIGWRSLVSAGEFTAAIGFTFGLAVVLAVVLGAATPRPANERYERERHPGEHHTGERPVQERHTGERPVQERHTGEHPVQERRTGEHPVQERHTGEHAIQQRRTRERPVQERHTGEHAVQERHTGEHAIQERRTGQRSSGQRSSGQRPSGRRFLRRGLDATAEDWLSSFRPAGAEDIAEPGHGLNRELVQPAQEGGTPFGYADDGWSPEKLPASYGGWPGLADDPPLDPAPELWQEYLTRSLPASEPETSRIYSGGLPPGGVSDSLEVDDTVPIPAIILDGAAEPVPARTHRAQLQDAGARDPLDSARALGPEPSGRSPTGEVPATHAEPVSAPARAKLDQIKDLYLTAEAIGEDALVKHFDEVSQRQRQLIREYFAQAGLDLNHARRTADEPRRNGASLPG